jgi:hypothetical protein
MINQLKREVEKGVSIENAITQLHEKGFTITHSMRILKTVYGISLKEAKNYVSNHPVWESIVIAAKPLHDELIASLGELLTPTEEEEFTARCEITTHSANSFSNL